MDLSPNSGDWCLSADTVDTTARLRSRGLATTASDELRLSSSDVHVAAIDEAFAATAGTPRIEPRGGRVSALRNGDGVETPYGDITRRRDPVASPSVGLSGRSPRWESSERVVRGSAPSTATEFQGPLGIVRSDDVTRLLPHGSSPRSADDEVGAMGPLGSIVGEDRERVADGIAVSSAIDTRRDETVAAGVERNVSERERPAGAGDE